MKRIASLLPLGGIGSPLALALMSAKSFSMGANAAAGNPSSIQVFTLPQVFLHSADLAFFLFLHSSRSRLRFWSSAMRRHCESSAILRVTATRRMGSSAFS